MSLIDVYPIDSIPPEPWRNGGGVTKTIATGGSQWRVSLASIERDGPYSRFPGMSRVSLVLSGNGVTLQNRDSVVQLRPLVVATYDGDKVWDATLVDGPSMALNAMTVKGRYRANVRLVNEPVVVRPGCAVVAIALDRGCTFAEGTDTVDSAVLSGNVLVSELHARPLRLAPQFASADTAGREPHAVLVTIEPAPV
ncbi:HutD family protein [Burkholderia ambifaria]|uniref:HutD/Ves family protein n=1 Tax=Burkholderia ambifaria TaxID=152480 RepID=UPI001B97B4F4|nr:HutD family protein [Burkholderia ambifaria]MBR8184204.1 HutD family protein [Burkholderia ambifaria]